MVVLNNFSMWTKPKTIEQVEFFSLHYEERKAYSIGALIIQTFWAICDMPAFMAILLSIAQYIPFLLYIHTFIAFGIVFSLHFILKATLKTRLHYMLQEATWSDGVAKGLKWQKAKAPIAIAVVLFACSSAGLFIFERQNGYKANIANNDNTELLNETDKINDTYASIELSIEKSAKAKSDATLSDLDRKITNLKAKKPINNWHKGVIAGDLAEAKAKRNKLAAQINNEKSAKLDSLAIKKTAALQQASTRFEKKSAFLNGLNDSELAKQKTSENFGSKYSWIISLVFMLLFFGVQTKLAAINYKSGIYPIKEFDDRGSLFNEFIEVVGDIFYRRGSQLITMLHKFGSVAEIEKPDGTLGIHNGNYNASAINNNVQNATAQPLNDSETQQTDSIPQQSATDNEAEAQQSETVITEAQQLLEKAQQEERERLLTEKAAFEAEKQRFEAEKAAALAKQQAEEQERKRKEQQRLAEIEARNKATEAARLQQIATEKAEADRKAQQLEQDRIAAAQKAQQLKREKEEAEQKAQQELQEKLTANDIASETLAKIRSEISNLKHDNGVAATIVARLNVHFKRLDDLVEKGYLTNTQVAKIATRKAVFQELLKEKGVTNG